MRKRKAWAISTYMEYQINGPQGCHESMGGSLAASIKLACELSDSLPPHSPVTIYRYDRSGKSPGYFELVWSLNA